ncbi:hypothetical protein [Calidifontibacter indicus]|uniref:hypothetical protein n=1 Tax=Calidifontibacter indicus TaxID=419650 RepID=UPI003D755752
MTARARALALLEDSRHDHNTREAELLIRSAQVYATLARAEATERQTQLLREAVRALAQACRAITEWLRDDMDRTAARDNR